MMMATDGEVLCRQAACLAGFWVCRTVERRRFVVWCPVSGRVQR